jgi:glycosyltransferase involved in cell wall biosynthesis
VVVSPEEPLMHIFFVLPYMPSPVRVRSYQFVRTLLRRGHRITLAAPIECEENVRASENLRAAGVVVLSQPLGTWRKLWNCMSALPSADPLQAAFSWQPTLAAQVGTILRSCTVDAVHVEHLRGARYAFALAPQLAPSVPLVWDAVDSITHLFEQTLAHSRSSLRRLIARFEIERTRRCEALLLHQCAHATVTSAVDRSALLQAAGPGAAPITVIPNGVDLEMFRPEFDREPEAETIVFSGRMSYHANAAAAQRLVRQILPRVRALCPTVRLKIVGRDPAPDVCVLADEDAGVTVTGAVDDLAAHLRSAAVAAVPLVYGAGVQNKVLEALACGTPVVADPLATRALDPSCADALLTADDDDAFAAQIVRLFGDAALRRRLAYAGRAFVEQHHSWEQACAALEDVYRGKW